MHLRADVATRLAIVRHGQSTWNLTGRWQGQADPPLAAAGEEQAVEAGERLAGLGVTSVVASDLVRARRTAEIVADALRIGPITVYARLREYDVGDWSGFTKAEIEAKWPGQQAAWFRGSLPTTPGGEGREGFAARVHDAILEVVDDAERGSVLLVVTHGGVIRALERASGADPVPIANLSGRWFEVDSTCTEAERVVAAGEPISLVGDSRRTASPSA